MGVEVGAVSVLVSIMMEMEFYRGCKKDTYHILEFCDTFAACCSIEIVVIVVLTNGDHLHTHTQ